MLEWANALDVVHLFSFKATGLVICHDYLRCLLRNSKLTAASSQLRRIIAVEEVGDEVAAEGSRLARLDRFGALAATFLRLLLLSAAL